MRHIKTGSEFDKFGTERYYMNGILHRTDGPAVLWGDGAQEWYCNGKLHRTDGPAYIHQESSIWYVNGYCHRTNGPAYVNTNGFMEWYINGHDITTEVNQWMTQLDIFYPFDKEHQALFLLTFGGK